MFDRILSILPTMSQVNENILKVNRLYEQLVTFTNG